MTKLPIVHLLLAVVCLAGCCLAVCAQPADKSHGQVVTPKPYAPRKKTPLSDRGKTLFARYKCATCHTTGGTGGCLAPPLDGIGARRTEQFIKLRITRGEKYESQFNELFGMELMPHLRIPPADADAIAHYLLTVGAPKAGYRMIGHEQGQSGNAVPPAQQAPASKPKASNVSRGRALLSSKGCFACHGIGNLGGSFAPKFDGVGGRLSRDAIMNQMKNAQLLNLGDDAEYGARGTTMPPLDLTDAEINDLADYLTTLK